MNIILKDGGLVHSREITIGRSAPQTQWKLESSHPLVKTFSKLVFPHAPSPLSQKSITFIQSITSLPAYGARRACDATKDGA